MIYGLVCDSAGWAEPPIARLARCGARVIALNSTLELAQCPRQPFAHAVFETFFDSAIASDLLTYLESEAEWHADGGKFYRRKTIDLMAQRGLHARRTVGSVMSVETVNALRGYVETIFSCELSGRVEVLAQLMEVGDRIGPHTDEPRGGSETHRVVVNLNRGFENHYGGQLVLFTPHALPDSLVIVPPVHNSAVAMEFSTESWHYVEEIRASQRYSVIYSLWRHC